MATKDNERVIRGSGDFLKDMGYDNPDEMRLKFALANSIALTIEDLGLKQVEAAKLTGLAQSDISRIVNGIVKDVAVFRLMSVLASLGKDISITVADSTSEHGSILLQTVEPEPTHAMTP